MKTLVRLLKDLRVRFEGLSELTVWMLELLVLDCSVLSHLFVIYLQLPNCVYAARR